MTAKDVERAVSENSAVAESAGLKPEKAKLEEVFNFNSRFLQRQRLKNKVTSTVDVESCSAKPAALKLRELEELDATRTSGTDSSEVKLSGGCPKTESL